MLRSPVRFFEERFARHGAVFKSRTIFPVVFLVGAEANHQIMISERDAFSYRGGYGALALGRTFANSIMLVDGDDAKRIRAILTPAVGKLAIRETSQRVYEIWSKRLDDMADGGAHDCYQMSQRTTFDVAANTLSGLALGDEINRFRPHFEQVIDGTMAATQHRIPFGKLDRGLKAREALIEMLQPRVRAARVGEPKGLLGQLAQHRDENDEALSSNEVAAHILMLMWAAYDTTASSASWVLHVLARWPHWQRRLREEATSVLGDDPVTSETAPRLHQTTWFMRELERMYPSVLFFPRTVERDFEFRGYHIPYGTATYYSPYLSHRDPASFDEPNRFDPDRWDPDRSGRKPKPGDLVGFGGGPRICLGKVFAQLQLKILISTLVRRYDLSPDTSSQHTVQGLPIHHPNNSRVVLTRR
jgi:cytochrome P450